MLDLFVSLAFGFVVAALLMKFKVKQNYVLLATFVLGLVFAILVPAMLPSNQNAYGDVLGVAPADQMRLLNPSGNVLNYIRLINASYGYASYIVIGLNLVAVMVGWLVAFAFLKRTKKH